MTQNPSWMTQKLVDSFKFLMFPSSKNRNNAAPPKAKNPNRFRAKNRWHESKLDPLQKIIQRRFLNHWWRKLCANYMSLKKFTDLFQPRRPSACRVCPHAMPLKLVQKRANKQTRRSIPRALRSWEASGDICAPEGLNSGSTVRQVPTERLPVLRIVSSSLRPRVFCAHAGRFSCAGSAVAS